MPKRCFVISPIGAEGSDIREHADAVFDYIIKPAMDEVGIEPRRSDHMQEPGKISDQMFDAILNDDLCVAVLTYDNPNVFYELAVAQWNLRPVIILLEKGRKLPFDIGDLRCVYYDLRPKAVAERAYASAVVAHVRALESTNWKASSPVVGLAPASAGLSHHDRFVPKSMEYGDPEAWLKLLRSTGTGFDLMGIALGSWKRGKGFGKTLAEKARAGCKVRVLLMHPDNPSLRELINPTIEEEDVDAIIHKIEEMRQFFSKVAEGSESMGVRQIRRGCPHFFLARSDEHAVFIQYLFGEKSGYSPLWQCAKGSALYGIMAHEFDTLWDVNGTAAD